jgi:DNA-binding NtrC family response regulator
VRELKNALERALVLARGDEIAEDDLPEEVRSGRGAAPAGGEEWLAGADYRQAKRQFEAAYITRKLEEHRWNVSRTTAAIGLHRQSLQEKLRELGIQRPGKAPAEEE